MRILTFVILLLSVSAHAQLREYYNGRLISSVDTLNGKYNGTYTLYYKGNIAVQGQFKDNLRVGKWTFADSAGAVNLVRQYTAPYAFTDTYNKTTVHREIYSMQRDSAGLIPYPYVGDRDLLQSKVCYYYLPQSHPANKALFENNALAGFLMQYMLETPDAEVYKEGHFTTKATPQECREKLGKYLYEVVGFKIREMHYFNSVTHAADRRVLGICPVVYIPQLNATTELYWIFYPAIRQGLAGLKTTSPGQPFIQSVEDVFMFRQYAGQLYCANDNQEYHTPFENKNTTGELYAVEYKILRFEDICIQYQIKKGTFK